MNRFCTECGAELAGRSRYCSTCGSKTASISEAKEGSTTQQDASSTTGSQSAQRPFTRQFRSSRGKAIGLVAGLLVAVSGLLALVMMVRSDSSTPDSSSTNSTIPVPPSDLAKKMCAEIGKRIWVGPEDSFGLDLDGDGWGCEEFSTPSAANPETGQEQIEVVPPDFYFPDPYPDDEYFYDPYCEDPYVDDPYCEEYFYEDPWIEDPPAEDPILGN